MVGGGVSTYRTPTERRSPELNSAIDLYFGSKQDAFEIVKAAAPPGPYSPLLREAKDYDDFRAQLTEIVQAANRINPLLNVRSTVERIEEELGLTEINREVLKTALRRSPALLQWIEESGEYDAPKWMYDYVRELGAPTPAKR